VSDRFHVALVTLVLTGLTVAALAGHHAWSGPELFKIDGDHGVNLADLPVAACWAAGVYSCWRLWQRSD
jgi:hypothetical protein